MNKCLIEPKRREPGLLQPLENRLPVPASHRYIECYLFVLAVDRAADVAVMDDATMRAVQVDWPEYVARLLDHVDRGDVDVKLSAVRTRYLLRCEVRPPGHRPIIFRPVPEHPLLDRPHHAQGWPGWRLVIIGDRRGEDLAESVQPCHRFVRATNFRLAVNAMIVEPLFWNVIT